MDPFQIFFFHVGVALAMDVFQLLRYEFWVPLCLLLTMLERTRGE